MAGSFSKHTGGDVSVALHAAPMDVYKALLGNIRQQCARAVIRPTMTTIGPPNDGWPRITWRWLPITKMLDGVTYGDNGITLSQTTHDEGGEIFGDGVNDLKVDRGHK